MIETLKHHFHIFLVQLKNNWVREAIYRANFLTTAVVDLIWIGVEFSFFTVIYANVPTIAGWTQAQVYFFLGIFFASDALHSIFFQTNFWRFSDLVHKGELDIVLTKPVSTVFLTLTRWMSLTSIFNVLLGLVIVIRYADEAGFTGGWKWALLPLWLGVGLLTQVLLRFAFSIWVFWTERSWALARLYYQFYAFATKPDSLYPKIIRYTILTALPFAFIGSVPARALLRGLSLPEYAYIAVVLSVLGIMDVCLWRWGIQRYQSASS